MKRPKDKRTKEYKQWKANFDKKNSIGLGDAIEKVTSATGIKKAAEAFTPEGKDCGCKERKEKLNGTRIKYPNVRCFTESQFSQWTEFRKLKTGVTRDQQTDILIPIYLHLFARDLKKPRNCCIDTFIEEIDTVYKTYL